MRKRGEMEYKLIIPYTLPSLNEYIKENRRSLFQANRLKSETEADIVLLCREQLSGVKIDKPVFIRYLWVEPDRRKDLDNISFARKFVQDGLVKAGVLKNDTWRYVKGFADEFAVDKDNPHVEVVLIEQ